MLIHLTEQCDQECIHCMVNATKNGKHMTEEVFNKMRDFLLPLVPVCLHVSGGELTQHPLFFEHILDLYTDGHVITLGSNGHFISSKEKVSKIKTLLNLKGVLGLQISTNEKFYPNHNLIMEKKKELENLYPEKVSFEEPDIKIVSIGRAWKNKIPYNTKQLPSCANVFLIPRQIKNPSFKGLLDYLEKVANKFCKPSIGIDGSIYPGEYLVCQKIGHISDFYEDIINNILKKIPCNSCGLASNLPERAVSIIRRTTL